MPDQRLDPRAHAVQHLRRYPRWYAAAAVWLIAMVALPVVELDPLQIFHSPAPSVPAAPGTPAASVETPSGSGPDADVAPTSDAPGTVGDGPLTPTSLLETVPPEEVPPELIDELFDMFPPPQALPDVPENLQPVVRAVAPLATQGCTGLGLAGLVVAVVAPSAEGVPLERILPYLAPATGACANFPIPETHTVCEADKPLIFDLGGVTKTPPILGLGIDQLAAIEAIINTATGGGFLNLSETARDLLGCEVVTE
jgi:hypothetical protein